MPIRMYLMLTIALAPRLRLEQRHHVIGADEFIELLLLIEG